jgi:Na+-transporting NADH:ubiquinone oxidoreductase subunit NqrB
MMASALLGTGVFFVWQSALLPFGNVGLPGPGFFPFVLGIALGVVALAIVISAARQERPDGEAEVISLGHRDTLVVLAALVGAGLFFERLGTYATLWLLTSALLLLVARTSPWRAALGASLGMVAIWAFFKVLLGVQLPAGPF